MSTYSTGGVILISVYRPHLHGLRVDFPHVYGQIFSSGCDQIVPVATNRKGTDLARVRNQAHCLVGVSIERHL